MTVQSLATLPLVFLGPAARRSLILIPALFIGFFGHVTAIVAYTVTATSGLADEEQGLATGLTSMTQQVGHHRRHPDPELRRRDVGSTELAGIHLALGVDVVVTLVSVVVIWFALRPRGERPTAEALAGPSSGILGDEDGILGRRVACVLGPVDLRDAQVGDNHQDR